MEIFTIAPAETRALRLRGYGVLLSPSEPDRVLATLNALTRR